MTTTAVRRAAERAPAPARRVRLTPPARLRLWTGAVLVLAGLTLLASGVAMAQLRDRVTVIGERAAPQAATASDLYFALSDLDAQVARLIMVGNDPDLSTERLDALRTYQQRGAEITADLAAALGATATDDPARTTLQRLADGLAVYRQLAGQAMAVQGEAADQTAGAAPPATLGYYSQATTLLHADLLPAAMTLRQSSRDTLDRAYADQRAGASWSVGLILLSGGTLLVVLLLFHHRLTTRYRRILNPWLLAAALCTAGLVAACCFTLVDETGRLGDAQRQDFAPYLALTAAQAVSYDAAADSSRYVIASNPAYIQTDYARKASCLVDGGSCSGDRLGGLASLSGDEALRRWTAYQNDHDRAVRLVDGGDRGRAIDLVTGIARGDAAFDFYYYDAAVSGAAAAHRRAFDAALADARDELSGWSLIPAALMLAAMALALLGVRPRLAEYRR